MPHTERQAYTDGKPPEGNGWYITNGSGKQLTRQQIKRASGDIFWERVVKTPKVRKPRKTQKKTNIGPKATSNTRHRLGKGLSTFERYMTLREIKREEELAKKRGITYKYTQPKPRKTIRKTRILKKFKNNDVDDLVSRMAKLHIPKTPNHDVDNLVSHMAKLHIPKTPDHSNTIENGLEVIENVAGSTMQSNNSTNINRMLHEAFSNKPFSRTARPSSSSHIIHTVKLPQNVEGTAMVEEPVPTTTHTRTSNRGRIFNMAMNAVKKQKKKKP